MNTELVHGRAGTGKTELLKRRVAEDPEYGVLASTTGISAMNLGTFTLHSLLTYFNTESLERKARSGKLKKSLHNLAAAGRLGKNILIDEVSMMEAKQLDILTLAMDKAFAGQRGIVVSGDFNQLPPVNGEFAFKADCWSLYEANHTAMTKVYRQTNIAFLEALGAVRRGDPEGAAMLEAAGVQFSKHTNPKFPGVTLVPTNQEANEINNLQMAQLFKPPVIVQNTIKGKPSLEWGQIPDIQMFKPGTKVMLTANDKMGGFANGDLGTLIEILGEGSNQVARVLLDRTGLEIAVPKFVRKNIDYSEGSEGLWIGEIRFMPLKLAYALTIHKSQGLTIPAVQLHINHWFSGEPALIYVAASRVREAANLSVIGTVQELAKRIKSHPEAARWL